MGHEIANKVLVTRDYGVFNLIVGNRIVKQRHVNTIKKSLDDHQVKSPIIVNTKMEVIDGQHRLEACRQAGLPVYYIVIEDSLNTIEIQRLNTTHKNWTVGDYTNLYIATGNQHYVTYLMFREKFHFGHNESLAMLTGGKPSGTLFETFRAGDFKVTDYSKAVMTAQKLLMVKDYYDGYKRRSFVYAMITLFEHPDYDHNEFLKKLSYQTRKMVHVSTLVQYVELIEEIYNFKRSKRNKVRFF